MTYIDDQIQQMDLAAALAAVSDERREYALRYRHELGQRQCVAAYLLVTTIYPRLSNELKNH